MVERTLYSCCPLCDSLNSIDVLKGDCSNHVSYDSRVSKFIQWKKCLDCQHIFTNGFYTKESYEIIFSKTQSTQTVGDQIEDNRIVSSKIVDKVLPYQSDGTWLDVGFGNGSLLFTAQEYGFNPIGIDLRIENVRILKSLKIDSHCLDLTELVLDKKCNVISMADVLEHMPFPRKGLLSANKLLNTNGVLFISLPNTESILWELMNEQNSNPYWDELEHYHNFSRTRLYRLLNEFGFKVMRYGISERYRACMELIAIKINDK